VKYGEITPSPGPGLFSVVQDPLGALGALFFGHPQQNGVSATSILPCDFGGKKARFTVYFRFGKELGPACGLVELFFIIIQLQIHKHPDQVYQNWKHCSKE